MQISTLGLITIKTPAQLDALSVQTYIFGAVAGQVFLVISALIANGIKFEGGSNPKDPGRRKIYFWVLLVLSFIAFFLYNMFVVAKTITPNLQSKFMTTNIVGSLITILVYFILGFILSKMFSTGKLGSWFSFKK